MIVHWHADFAGPLYPPERFHWYLESGAFQGADADQQLVLMPRIQ